jgi:hypothetical protein
MTGRQPATGIAERPGRTALNPADSYLAGVLSVIRPLPPRRLGLDNADGAVLAEDASRDIVLVRSPARADCHRAAAPWSSPTSPATVQRSSRPGFWAMAAVTGVATGLFGDLMMWILFQVQYLAFGYHSAASSTALSRPQTSAASDPC